MNEKENIKIIKINKNLFFHSIFILREIYIHDLIIKEEIIKKIYREYKENAVTN